MYLLLNKALMHPEAKQGSETFYPKIKTLTIMFAKIENKLVLEVLKNL